MRYCLNSVAAMALIGALSSASIESRAQTIEVQDRIKVRILKSDREVTIAGFGLRIHGEEAQIQTEILPKKKKLHIVRKGNEWVVTNLSDTSQVQYFKGSELKIRGDLIKINDLAAADSHLLIAKGRRFDLISDLSIEEYLKGVIPSEMPIGWPLEAIKAQTVAARSYALAVMSERSLAPYHVDDTINHQVFQLQNYSGTTSENREKIELAINETRGIYLVQFRGSPYKTFFHSDCGGTTEEPKVIWNISQINGTVKDDRCAMNSRSAWKTQVSRSELNRIFARTAAVGENIKIDAITVASNSDSGRIHELLLHFKNNNDEPQSRAINAQNFRKALGFNRVKSTKFDFNLTESALEISGRGHGHGAGMCQKGARFMALSGANYSAILKRYYPKARIKRPAVLAEAQF